MDDIVRQALAKWPNVPHCTGWLLLDRRGEWRLRDDAAQAAGELGSPIRHAALNAFIGRNYECDAQGQWFFQNGPQRVCVGSPIHRGSSGSPSATGSSRSPTRPARRSNRTKPGSTTRVACCFARPARRRASRRCTITISGCSPIMRISMPRSPCCAGATATLPLGSIVGADVPARFGYVASPAQQARNTADSGN